MTDPNASPLPPLRRGEALTELELALVQLLKTWKARGLSREEAVNTLEDADVPMIADDAFGIGDQPPCDNVL